MKLKINNVIPFLGIVISSVIGTVFSTMQMKNEVADEVKKQLEDTSSKES